jgi:hypothetical protein
LLSVVTAARRSLRPIDLLFRGAPDQLIVLMLQADRDTATSVKIAIEKALLAESVQGTAKSPAEISMVISSVPEDGSTLAEAIDLAVVQLSTGASQPRGSRPDPPARSVH